MRDLDELFAALEKSSFCKNFHLKGKDLAYLQDKGITLVLTHAEDFINTRIAPAIIPNDGKQTPMRGHPVFVAQHATATCCRGCLQKWHAIPKNRVLTSVEKTHILKTLTRWLAQELSTSTINPQRKNIASHPKQADIFE